jgi:ABC-type multidrug transport system fused ATPase/permease subunit
MRQPLWRQQRQRRHRPAARAHARKMCAWDTTMARAWWESVFACKTIDFLRESRGSMSPDVLNSKDFIVALMMHMASSNILEQSAFAFNSGTLTDKALSVLLVGIIIPLQNATFQNYDRRNSELIARMNATERDLLHHLDGEFKRSALGLTEDQELQLYYKLAFDRHVETTNVIKTVFEVCCYVVNLATHRRFWWPHEALAAGAFFNTIANRMVAAVDAVGAKGAECNDLEYETDAVIDDLMANLNIIYGSKKEHDFVGAIYANVRAYNETNRNYHRNSTINDVFMANDQYLSGSFGLLKLLVTLDTYDVQVLQEIGFSLRHLVVYAIRLKKIQDKLDKLDLVRFRVQRAHSAATESDEPIAAIDESCALFDVRPFRFSYSEACVLDVTKAIHVPSRAWTFLHGNSGTGKTTFVHLLLKLVSPGAVEVAFFGNRQYNYGSVRDYVSVVTSKGDIFQDRSVAFNVTFGVQASESMSERDIRHVVTKYFGLFELGDYDAIAHKLVRHMSTGEQQRIKLVRLIVGTLASPQKCVWILDEVTSNVDAEVEAVVLTELRRVQAALRLSVIHISHNPASRDYCDYRMRIDDKKDISVTPNG